MFQHHQDSLNIVTEKMKKDNDVLALILAGSIAHGFADRDADVDIMIVVSHEEYERRYRDEALLYLDRESCTYEGGYVDGKYISTKCIRDVIRQGGEPARFAFKDAAVVFTRIPELEGMMREAARYPAAYKAARMRRLYCRFLEWCWLYDEAVKKKNAYLFGAAVGNIILYGGRVILACNELLYPFHKWFLKVLEAAPEKPNNIMTIIDSTLHTRSPESISEFITAIKGFRDWGIPDDQWSRILMSGEDIGCPESEL